MNYSMRKLPFWRELIKQSDLEAQYEVLKQRGYSDHDTAIHLARFAEARMHNAADRRISELEKLVRSIAVRKTLEIVGMFAIALALVALLSIPVNYFF